MSERSLRHSTRRCGSALGALRRAWLPECDVRSPSAWGRAVGVLCAALACAGCGNALYAVSANAASSKLAEARELGAEQYAPYEYYMAREHLQKAQTEAAEADYGDASDLSDAAEKYAEKAIALSREAHRGAGR